MKTPRISLCIMILAMMNIVVFLGGASEAGAQTAGGGAHSECIAATGTDWTPSEAWIWQRLCFRASADMNIYVAESPTRSVQVSTKYLTQIILDEPFRSALGSRSINIENAVLSGPLMINNETITRSISIRSSVVEGRVNLSDTDFEGDLDLGGSSFPNGIDLKRVAVEGSVELNFGGEYLWVDLSGSKIDGAVDLSNSLFRDSLILSSATIGGSVTLEGGTFEAIFLNSSRISGSLDAPRSTVAGILDASSTDISGHVWMNSDSSFSQVDLRWANIRNNIVATSSRFGTFAAASATVSGTVFLSESVFGDLDLRSSTINAGIEAEEVVVSNLLNLNAAAVRQDIHLHNSHFNSMELIDIVVGGELRLYGSIVDEGVDLRNSAIRGSLALSDGSQSEVEWGPEAFLDLRVGEVGTIDDTDAAWPSITRLDGLVIQLPSGLQTEPGTGFIDRDLNWYLDWLGGEAAEGSQFSRQPYVHLEQNLREAGRGNVADEIAIARLNQERRAANGFHSLFAWVDWVTIRYGYRPERALLLAVILWVVGAAVVQNEKRYMEDMKITSAVLFSIDRLVPLITFSKANEEADISKMSRWSKYYFYFHVSTGYLVGILLVATLARFTRA